MRPLLQSAVLALQLAARNVSYNAVCFFHKLVERFDTKDMGLNWRRIVLGERLVEDGRDVHLVERLLSTCWHQVPSPQTCPSDRSLRLATNDVAFTPLNPTACWPWSLYIAACFTY